MDIENRNILVLGGAGMVGAAVCRELLAHRPGRLVVAARRAARAERAVALLREEFPEQGGRIAAASGDVFLRAEWQAAGTDPLGDVLGDRDARRRLIADTLEPLDDGMVTSSLLAQMIAGTAPGLDGSPAEIVVDCMNTATALSYQDVYGAAQGLANLAANNPDAPDWPDRAETLLASLSVPQLVRHTQIAFEAMRRAGTEAYLKVGTSGTGGMGFNVPYTHGEERPSRLLLSKAALAGAQTMLLFLMARTPGPPRIVKEVKPTALIGWRDIGHGPIRRRGEPVSLFDCPPEQAVPRARPDALAPEGGFGVATGERLEAVYIDTGENGLFSAGEFAAITALGQMRLVTPEEVARHLVSEIKGENTGRDVIAGLDASVTGGSYRGGFLRDAALARLRDLEDVHGESVAFEILGPPRLSKLLFEAFLLKQTHDSVEAIVSSEPAALAEALEARVRADARTRQRIISIGLPILLSDAEHLLRGPVVKSTEPHHGWVDLTADNMRKWQERLRAMRRTADAEAEDASSRLDQCFTSFGETPPDGMFEIGDMVAWIFIHEDQGRRMKD